MDSEKKVYEVLGPLWYKNTLFWSQKSFFKIFTITIFVYSYYSIIMQNFNKFLMWIVRARRTGFWTQFGIKMPHFWYQLELFSKYSLLLSLVTHTVLASCKIKKNRVDSENKANELFGPKMK